MEDSSSSSAAAWMFKVLSAARANLLAIAKLHSGRRLAARPKKGGSRTRPQSVTQLSAFSLEWRVGTVSPAR